MLSVFLACDDPGARARDNGLDGSKAHATAIAARARTAFSATPRP